MARTFCCGFECGQLSASGAHWQAHAGSPSIQTTTVRSGSRALRCNAAGAAVVAKLGFTAASFNVTRVYMQFASLPTGDTALVTTDGASGGVAYQSSDGKLYAYGNTGFGASGVSVTTGVWYRIDTHIVGATTLAQVDGVDLGNAEQPLTSGSNLFLGVHAAVTCDVFFDDLACDGNTYPISAGYVNHFIPTADGTHNVAGAADFQRTLTGTDILNATTTAFQLVDDVPLESGASVDWINMIAPPNATDYVECIFGPAPGISTPTVAPRAVEVIAGIHQATTATGSMEIRLNDNGTTNAMYTATTQAGVTSVAYKRKHYATAPTGGAWTVVSGAGNFNNLRVRFGSPAAVDAVPDQYFDCIMVEAEFAPAAAAFLPNHPLTIQQAVPRSSVW